MKSDVYQIITDRIIRLLEAGTVPWHHPWKSGSQMPQNFVSRKSYRGINLFLLNAAGYPSPYWLTFKQVQSLKGKVRKGEQSFPVVFWKVLKEETNAEAKVFPFLRYYNVFNLAQCEGIEAPEPVGVTRPFNPIDQCEKVVAGMQNAPPIDHNGSLACYSPSLDKVTMPKGELFETNEAYYSTLFHELTHATGHVSRLNRKEITDPIRFGSDRYSREELVAEMGAAFLCGQCNIAQATISASANYIQAWLDRLKNDRKLVVTAATQAQKATDFILNIKSVAQEAANHDQPKEYKVVALRECPTPLQMQLCDAPARAAEYWHAHVATAPQFNSECECMVILFLNTRKRIRGHQLLTIGTMDCIHIHPREVFRAAVIAGSNAIVLMHNHPSGEPQPSDADVKVTRDLIRAGQLLRIEVLDHVIIGNPDHCSLRELGYFYS